jgi:hypothetical protein
VGRAGYRIVWLSPPYAPAIALRVKLFAFRVQPHRSIADCVCCLRAVRFAVALSADLTVGLIA